MKRSWNERFLTSVVARHGRPLLKFFVSRLPNTTDAPDLVQEVYLRLLRIERPDLIRVPEAYLFTIASNIAREHRLKSSSQPPQVALEDAPSSELPSDIETFATATPESAVLQAERLRRVERVLSQLSPKARASFIWHRRDGLTYEEIGTRLGVSRNMVKKYIMQALAQCRKHLDREDGG